MNVGITTLAAGALLALTACSGLGNTGYGILPDDVHKKPTHEEVAQDPCMHGDMKSCIDRCKGEDARACNLVGVSFEFDPEGAEGDPALASGFYRRACDSTYAPGCNNLAWLYLRGRGVPADPMQAFRLFGYAYDAASIACRRGDAANCLLAGELLDDGWVIREDATPVAFFARACDGGEARACAKATRQ